MRDRNATHGEPEDNFNTIADLWNVWMERRDKGKLTGTDVATMMLLMKVSRLITTPEVADHWVDMCGYAACGGGIATKGN